MIEEHWSLDGAHVRLRPLTVDDLASMLELSRPGFRSAADREDDSAELQRLVASPSTLATEGLLTLAVEHEGSLVGDIQARAPRYAFPPGVCEIGLTLFPQGRGRGLGTDAVRVLTAHLQKEGWSRVQASTPVVNVAMRRVLEKCGYGFEGVLRAFAPEPPGRVDYAMYASITEA